MTDPGCVLIVEDEFLISDLLSDMVEDGGWAVCGVADTADEAIVLAIASNPCVVLMDVRLRGGRDGVDAALAINGAVGCPVIFLTASREPATVARIAEVNPAAVLFKPFDFDILAATMREVIGRPSPPV